MPATTLPLLFLSQILSQPPLKYPPYDYQYSLLTWRGSGGTDTISLTFSAVINQRFYFYKSYGYLSPIKVFSANIFLTTPSAHQLLICLRILKIFLPHPSMCGME